MYILDVSAMDRADSALSPCDCTPFFAVSYGATMYAMAKRGASNGNGRPVKNGQAVLPHYGLPGLSAEFSTILADPPWQFQNRTGKVAPEHKRLKRYHTMTLQQILAMPVANHAADKSHLYLWVPNALLEEGLAVM